MLNDGSASRVRQRLEALLPPLSDSGNSQSTDILAGMISRRRLPHALIIEGGSDEYNDRAARLVARAYLCSCESPLAGECRACHLFESYGTHPDMYEIEGSGATGAISVDSVRDAKKRGSVVPTDAAGTVFLLEHGELMQKPAQNAFLKLFEEPPEGLMIIMTVTSRMKLLETIRSRGTVLHFEWPRDREGSGAAEAWETAQALAFALIAPTDADMLFALAPFCSAGAGAPEARRQLDRCLEALGEVLRQAVIISAGAGEDIFSARAEDNFDASVENDIKAGDRIINETSGGTEDHPLSEAAKELSEVVPPDRLTGLIYGLEPLRRALKNNASMPLLTAAVTERLRRAAGR